MAQAHGGDRRAELVQRGGQDQLVELAAGQSGPRALAPRLGQPDELRPAGSGLSRLHGRSFLHLMSVFLRHVGRNSGSRLPDLAPHLRWNDCRNTVLRFVAALSAWVSRSGSAEGFAERGRLAGQVIGQVVRHVLGAIRHAPKAMVPRLLDGHLGSANSFESPVQALRRADLGRSAAHCLASAAIPAAGIREEPEILFDHRSLWPPKMPMNACCSFSMIRRRFALGLIFL